MMPQCGSRLTAFVIKCFTRAAEFITVDAKLIDQSITFLKKRQLDSGEFTEQGIIVHQEFLVSVAFFAVNFSSTTGTIHKKYFLHLESR